LARHESFARRSLGPRNLSISRSTTGCKRKYDCGQSF
jgi:hypothetical protein